MRHLVLFLNELSCTGDPTPLREDILPVALSTLAALRAARRLRSDLLVASAVPLSSVVLGDGTSSLAAVLAGNDYKEEWRFLRALDQRNPWDTHPHAVGPGDLEEVSFQGQAGRGITWAKKNGSAVFSFGFPPLWDQDPLHATYAELTDTGEVMAVATDVANLSRLEHVQRNAELLHNYGGEVSPSSLVYEGNGFAVRMYFDDHDPPHFHVLLRRDTSDTQAKCRVDNFDLLAGELPAVLRRRVKEWARNRTVDLMRNWARCREGRHPFTLED